MTEIDTREIAETLMLDRVREIRLGAIWERLGDLPSAERERLTEEIDTLITEATITISFPETTQ